MCVRWAQRDQAAGQGQLWEDVCFRKLTAGVWEDAGAVKVDAGLWLATSGPEQSLGEIKLRP